MNWITVIGSGLAALIGALIGPFAKEALQDRFQKGRRRKEVSVRLTQIVVKLFRRMLKQVQSKANTDIYNYRTALLQKEKIRATEAGNLVQAEKAQKDVDGIFEYAKGLVKEQNEAFDYLVDLEAEMISIAIESVNYLKTDQHRQLQKSVKELINELESSEFTINGWTQMKTLEDLMQWHQRILIREVEVMNKKLNGRKDFYIAHFAEIMGR